MAESATTFHLVRHGHYDLLDGVLAGRIPGHSLSALGHAQARALADRFAELPIAAVISSPLQRARETAAPIADRLGLQVLVEERLNEIDFGTWSGSEFPALHAETGWAAYNRFRAVGLPPGGETMVAAQTRALAALSACRDRFPGRNIVLVSHADVIKAVLCLVLGMSLDLMRRLEIGPGSRSVLTMWETDARVDTVNQPPPG